ncbi:MAG: addiction module protein [bacterium]|nr:addiction module protein [bacterium]
MKKISVSDVLEMPIPERILLVEDIWDSISTIPEAVELTDEQRKLLMNRLEEYRLNPQSGSPWEMVKNRIRKA